MALPLDSTNPFAPSGNLVRRKRVDLMMRGFATLAALLAVGVLVAVLAAIASHGISAISLDFFTKAPPTFFGTGGILPEIVGTLLLVGLATCFAVPIGVLVAIFQSEFASARVAYPIRLSLDVLNGLPSIVIAVFVYGLLVLGSGQKGYAASVALAIIMVPLIARATYEVLQLVPQAQRDASSALGVSKWRTTVGIVLPACLSGIVTGAVLAIARGAGETAPMLLLSANYNPNQPVTGNLFGQPIPNIPMEIYNDSASALPSAQARGWGAALVLVTMILVVSLIARFVLARQRRKLYQ
jgi:phosphate transport system permease protein